MITQKSQTSRACCPVGVDVDMKPQRAGIFKSGDKVSFPVRMPNSERTHYLQGEVLSAWVGPSGGSMAEVLADGHRFAQTQGTSRMVLVSA